MIWRDSDRFLGIAGVSVIIGAQKLNLLSMFFNDIINHHSTTREAFVKVNLFQK